MLSKRIPRRQSSTGYRFRTGAECPDVVEYGCIARLLRINRMQFCLV